ncbi:AraC family transcriptional regulator [Paenibacillus sp. YYML68]|uniref:helix-turn-helix domain-containing protein n=1 Tax=Paenibacillus sp. YYML68 TaxID=2909250 RepID=UPI002492CC78|nr:AraC family transcriptional regulator [Paenibacillus sp. YYML68]
MRIHTIIRSAVLFPGESERWHTHKYDFIYIQSDHAVHIHVNRIQVELNDKTPGLFQSSHGPFSIHNKNSRPVTLQGIKFTCGINMPRDFYLTDFERTPFEALLNEETPNENSCSRIIKLLQPMNKPPQTPNNRERIDPRLIQLNRYIRKNYNTPISLQELADYVGVHPTYLSNTYSKVFKISPILYLNQLRMKAAVELMEDNGLTIKEIAESVGYNSVPQFSLIFKRFHAMTPSQYRKHSVTPPPS